MPDATIQMYGTTWCPDCIRAKQVLNKHSIAFVFHDIGSDKEALTYVEKVNRGMRSVPVILFPDGSVLVEPSNAELERKLQDIAAKPQFIAVIPVKKRYKLLTFSLISVILAYTNITS